MLWLNVHKYQVAITNISYAFTYLHMLLCNKYDNILFCIWYTVSVLNAVDLMVYSHWDRYTSR